MAKVLLKLISRAKFKSRSVNFCEFILQIIFAFYLFLNIFTIFPLTLIICFSLRTFVQLCARIFRPDLKKFVSSPSCLLAKEDIVNKPKLNVYINLVYDGHIEVEQLRALFNERVIQKVAPKSNSLMYPELKQYWTVFMNYSFWKNDDHFDLKNHVRIYDESYCAGAKELELIRGEDGTCEEDQLRSVLEALLVKPWKAGRSPWELLVIPNFKSRASAGSNLEPNKSGGKICTVLVLRIQHAMGDGYSILKLLLRDMMLVPPNIRINFPKMRPWKRILFGAMLPLKLPWDFAGCVIDSVDGHHSWHGWGKKNKLTRKIHMSLSKPINTELIKNVKNKYGVSYNAVLCAVAAGGCQRMMEAAGQKVPKEMACLVPFPLAGHPDGLVNHVTAHIFNWPTDTNLASEERLRKFSERLTPSKYFTAPLGFHLMTKLAAFMPNVMLKLRDLCPFPLALTSFPGPRDSPTFNGLGVNLVDLWAGVGPGTGTVGAIFCLVSMNDQQRFTMNIDKKIFPDEKIFQNFGQYVEEELKHLWETIPGAEDQELFILP